MNAIEIIEKKRDGLPLEDEEIRTFVDGYTSGEIPDYQAAAWCMAVYIHGMSTDETVSLTRAMAESGEVMDLSAVVDFAVDKHSSGGIGDKTSLVVVPLVASFGIPVAKMSGRGLSVFGGTLDKLESIRGLRVDLTSEEFLRQVEEHGIVLSGQSLDLAPADGRFYALRDVIGAVGSKPLMAASIMSKKIAAGTHGIVLDVKYGRGALMGTVSEARELAEIMVGIGKGMGRRVTALLSNMSQPLGRAVGNALEVREAIETLRGDGPEDFTEHCTVVAGHMLRLAGVASAGDLSDIRGAIAAKLEGGQALAKLRLLVEVQGGDVGQIDDPSQLPAATVKREVRAERGGYIHDLDALEVGACSLELGAGRKRKGDPVDPAVGIVFARKVGDRASAGDLLCVVHAADEASGDRVAQRLRGAFGWSDRAGPPLFADVILG